MVELHPLRIIKYGTDKAARIGIGREGYVPNVVYSCGAIIHNNELVIPYAMSDINSGIATVAVNELLNCMRTVA